MQRAAESSTKLPWPRLATSEANTTQAAPSFTSTDSHTQPFSSGKRLPSLRRRPGPTTTGQTSPTCKSAGNVFTHRTKVKIASPHQQASKLKASWLPCSGHTQHAGKQASKALYHGELVNSSQRSSVQVSPLQMFAVSQLTVKFVQHIHCMSIPFSGMSHNSSGKRPPFLP